MLQTGLSITNQNLMSDCVDPGPTLFAKVYVLVCRDKELNCVHVTWYTHTGSNLVTHGKLLCKEISDANIRTWEARAKKVAISGGLSTIWGFCRLGGRYFKNSENAILRGIEFHTTQHQNLRQNVATVPGICFILATIWCHFGRFTH